MSSLGCYSICILYPFSDLISNNSENLTLNILKAILSETHVIIIIRYLNIFGLLCNNYKNNRTSCKNRIDLNRLFNIYGFIDQSIDVVVQRLVHLLTTLTFFFK